MISKHLKVPLTSKGCLLGAWLLFHKDSLTYSLKRRKKTSAPVTKAPKLRGTPLTPSFTKATNSHLRTSSKTLQCFMTVACDSFKWRTSSRICNCNTVPLPISTSLTSLTILLSAECTILTPQLLSIHWAASIIQKTAGVVSCAASPPTTSNWPTSNLSNSGYSTLSTKMPKTKTQMPRCLAVTSTSIWVISPKTSYPIQEKVLSTDYPAMTTLSYSITSTPRYGAAFLPNKWWSMPLPMNLQRAWSKM